MPSIELSFCIPTYNRAQSVSRLVTNILRHPGRDIEVVVLDNGSTDDTLAVLRGIDDDRLRVYSNGENMGALYNMVHVIDKAKGRFLVYSTDQDHTDFAGIENFKLFLAQQPDLTCGFCEFGSQQQVEADIFAPGFDAINHVAYKSRHPTGYFFHNQALKTTKHLEHFSDYDLVDLFPLEFIFAELCLMGRGAIYHRPIFSPETGVMVVKHKSSTTDGNAKKAFFSPAARTKLAISYVRHVHTLQLTQAEKRGLTATIFYQELMTATLGYKKIMANEALCVHYYMQQRHIGYPELLKITASFYRTFVEQTIDLRGNRALPRALFRIEIGAALPRALFRIEIAAGVSYRLMDKIIKRLRR